MEKNSSDNKKSQQFKTRRVVKEEGDHSFEQGFKGGKTSSSYSDGVSKRHNGHGCVITNTASGLYVVYLLPIINKEHFISIKKDFVNVGIWRITQKTLEKIKATMPEYISLEDRDGGVCVDSITMAAWIERVENFK